MSTLVEPLAEPGKTALEAGGPPESRGLGRDAVKLLVAWRAERRLVHARFRDLPEFLLPGDLVVLNTSATLPAAVDATGAESTPLVVHFSTHLGGDRWVVELRHPVGLGSERWRTGPPGCVLQLAGGAVVTLIEPYEGRSRLWVACVASTEPVADYLALHGRPIRYRYVTAPWPLAAYQTVYATEPGSAEMPSAGRPFTPELLTRLVADGVGVTPLVLHTGVASLEAGETPYPERYRVSTVTAGRVNATRRSGGRVIAVGTTVVRALESAAGPDGVVRAAEGWADLVITPERGVRVVDGMLTGWHEPEASHLLMLEAVAGRDLLERSYAAARAAGYRWHEFGDVHLILP
jgi:S-adenosylmethionine:tRNA ribosyltransferase-isomerase